MSDYWNICIEEAFSEADIQASDQQIKTVVGAVDAGHEMYGESTRPRNTGPSDMEREIKSLKKKLEKELAKKVCTVCGGDGYIPWESIAHCGKDECHRCHGQGRY